jgi:hypothetical protein
MTLSPFQTLRLEALKLAVANGAQRPEFGSHRPEEVTARAQAYLAFLMAKPPAPQPGNSRSREAKKIRMAEILRPKPSSPRKKK